MGIIANEGRYIRSKSLRDSAVRRKHPLNFMSRAIASHHLISCEATRRLSSYRRKQITYKGYDVNHVKNLVILPMEERISCQYYVPYHKSAHIDSQLITHYESKVRPKLHLSNMVNELKGEADQEEDEKQKKNLIDDINAIDVLSGYHRIIGVKLARVLKGLNCESDAKDFVDMLDDLSISISGDIAKFRLLLIERGKYIEKGQPGCDKCRESGSMTNRTHFDDWDLAPSMQSVFSFCYKGKRLKTVYEQKQRKNKLKFS